jgi:hypothetical protein
MKKSILIIFLIALLLIPTSVLAVETKSVDLLGGVQNSILDTAIGILNYNVNLERIKVVSLGGDFKGGVPLWIFFGTFTLIFTILWVASGQVPMFKNDENKGARKGFVIALSLMMLLMSNVAEIVATLISSVATIGVLLFAVLGGYTIWSVFRGGWAANRLNDANTSKTLAQARKDSLEAVKTDKQTEEDEKRIKHAVDYGLDNQKTAITSLNKDLQTLLSEFNRHTSGPANRTIRDSLTKISNDLGKIMKFSTESNSFMTDVQQHRTGKSNTQGKLVFTTRKDFDTLSNDLGKRISLISSIVAHEQIDSNKPKLITNTQAAIKITAQMENDLAREEQLIHQI